MFALPNNRRDELRTIQIGDLVTEDKLSQRNWTSIVVSVGDMVTATLYRHGINPNISIVDYQNERKRCDNSLIETITKRDVEVIKVCNPPATITDELWDAIKHAYHLSHQVRIEVDGEEDLATLPAIVLSPADTTVVYGLPGRGIICVEVGKNERKKVEEILKKMEE